ncbi:uncharacterized protein LOC141641742 [Silene latifolia]|uniref:uncharacterized protein LOC141641742 n=1 Tax=Silene latifolia TaxID=37657 RepID=UPI003D77FBF6
MEIAICSKRKVGFLTGFVKRPTDDAVRAEAWDTCNSLLISWIFHNVEPPIKRSILYVRTAKEIWEYLQRQFSVSNGARKFRLNKELEDLAQGERSIFTQMTPEVNAWLDAQLKEQEERKLFQFLNGLHPSYTTMRTNVLMMSPLPTVEEAAAIFQHEEA